GGAALRHAQTRALRAMERRRDPLRPPRHDSRLAVAAAAPGGRATANVDSTASLLTRRRLIILGGAASALASLSPQPAAAVLKLNVTEGNVQPVPIAIPDLVGAGLEPGTGRNRSPSIAPNLRSAGFCAPR